MTHKTQAEVFRLEDEFLMPKKLKDPNDFDKGLVERHATYHEYLEAGRHSLSERRKVGAIMRLLPNAVTKQVRWEFGNFDGQPDVLRRSLRERMRWPKWVDTGPQAPPPGRP